MDLELAKKIVELNNQIEKSEENINILEKLRGSSSIEIGKMNGFMTPYMFNNSIRYHDEDKDRIVELLIFDERRMIKQWKAQLER